MIEQTELIVTKWQYDPPAGEIDQTRIYNNTQLDVQKKKAPTKKGIAHRFTCQFTYENQVILEYVGEDSYVIDFEDRIDINELRKMVANSFSKFSEKFELRKMVTILYNQSISPINEYNLNLAEILPLLD
jgi:hypothetical protein